MHKTLSPSTSRTTGLPKCPTGIQGLDEITGGGLPRGRPTLYGLEMHLARMFKEIAAFQPAVVIVDPITSLPVAGTDSETKGMATRLIDFLKGGQVTSLFASLTHGGHALQQSEIAMSSLMDSGLLLQDFEGNRETKRRAARLGSAPRRLTEAKMS